MFPGFLFDWLQVAVVAATVAAVWFIVQYTLTSPWWHDQVGRTVVAMDAATLILLVPNVIRFFWRSALSSLEIGWTDVTAITLTFFIVVIRCTLWWRIERPHSPVTQARRYAEIRRARRADKDM